jgi:hypothetical protein
VILQQVVIYHQRNVAYDQELEDIFQAFIVGITSLQGQFVRPRWQKIHNARRWRGLVWFCSKSLT